RALYEEAEKALLGAAALVPTDSAAVAADSLDVAELRLARGDRPGALAVATTLHAATLASTDRVRLAKVLLETDRADLAETLLPPAVANLDGADKAQASLLLARTHWDRGEAGKALPLAVDLAGAPTTPADLLPRALILEADCLCALDRGNEAGAV